MSNTDETGAQYPHTFILRASNGMAEAVEAYQRKTGLDRSKALRQMITAGAFELLGKDWRPTGKK